MVYGREREFFGVSFEVIWSEFLKWKNSFTLQ